MFINLLVPSGVKLQYHSTFFLLFPFSVSDVTPPPPSTDLPSATGNPQLNPFTPEWFAQIIGAAASAAATAAVRADRPRNPAPVPVPAAAPPPRQLNERKIPDFWEDKPDFWFRIFDAHLAHFTPSEQRCFDTLLPLLTPAARAVVHTVIRAPGNAPYSRARDSLLRHFGQTPQQQARECREARSLGDKLPTEFLDHLEALLPDVRVLFEVILLDALPDNARVAALQFSDVRAMATAADRVVQENRAAAASDRAVAAVQSLSLLDSAVDGGAPPLLPSLAPAVAAVGRDRRPQQHQRSADSANLCSNHKRWGRETYKCLAPSSCKMRGVLKPRPTASASGNAKAGGQ